MLKWDGKFDLKDLITLGTLIGTIAWTIAVQPMRIVADLNSRYASKERVDMIQERLDRIEGKLDRLIEVMR